MAMGNYLIVVMMVSETPTGPGDEDEVHREPECTSVTVCETTEGVAAVLDGLRAHPTWTWNVFEKVDGRYVRRSVTFKRDVIIS